MASASERTIRDAVAAKIRVAIPSARVVHELVCGSRRADLAAISRDRLILFEIKSERDTLERCEAQMRAFGACAHEAILVAHEKWFDRTPYTNGSPRLAWPHGRHSSVWCFPEPDAASAPVFLYRWEMPRPSLKQPRALVFLDLLWREELWAECSQHRILCGSRSTRTHMIEQMAWLMTGREIAEAVCRQLRRRSFPEADAPDCWPSIAAPSPTQPHPEVRDAAE